MTAQNDRGRGGVVTATGRGSGRKPGACGNPWCWLVDHSGPGGRTSSSLGYPLTCRNRNDQVQGRRRLMSTAAMLNGVSFLDEPVLRPDPSCAREAGCPHRRARRCTHAYMIQTPAEFSCRHSGELCSRQRTPTISKEFGYRV